MAMASTAFIRHLTMEAIAVEVERESQSLSPASTLVELALDSLRLSKVIVHIESKIGCDFSQDELIWFYEAATLDELADVTVNILAERGLLNRESSEDARDL